MTENPLAFLYLKTLVSIEEHGVMVSVADSAFVEGKTVHVITAWNPATERPSLEQNEVANQHLYELLVSRGLDSRRALGTDPDSDHFEESWAVSGLTDDEARAIGADFGQVAIFRLESGVQTVIACREDWSLSRSY